MLLTCTIDGVFVDLEVAGALGVMESIRKGTSNAKVVIFACVVHAREYTDALGRGELSSAEAAERGQHCTAHHDCEGTARTRAEALLPACGERPGDFERGRSGTTCAHDQPERRRHGGAHRESAQT